MTAKKEIFQKLEKIKLFLEKEKIENIKKDNPLIKFLNKQKERYGLTKIQEKNLIKFENKLLKEITTYESKKTPFNKKEKGMFFALLEKYYFDFINKKFKDKSLKEKDNGKILKGIKKYLLTVDKNLFKKEIIKSFKNNKYEVILTYADLFKEVFEKKELEKIVKILKFFAKKYPHKLLAHASQYLKYLNKKDLKKILINTAKKQPREALKHIPDYAECLDPSDLKKIIESAIEKFPWAALKYSTHYSKYLGGKDKTKEILKKIANKKPWTVLEHTSYYAKHLNN